MSNFRFCIYYKYQLITFGARTKKLRNYLVFDYIIFLIQVVEFDSFFVTNKLVNLSEFKTAKTPFFFFKKKKKVLSCFSMEPFHIIKSKNYGNRKQKPC